MRKILLFTDYNLRFGSKASDVPYRSGMDKKLIGKFFSENGFEAIFMNMADAQSLGYVNDIPVLYTSTEDPGYYYKSYIEDIVLYLSHKGAKLIPRYEFLRANNNKSFMELLRKKFEMQGINTLKSWSFGSLEELFAHISELDFPVIVKKSEGAKSRGVFLAKNNQELISIAKKISRTSYIVQDIKDALRPLKHRGYKRQSLYRNKFIVQQFIPNLKNDWKALVYFDSVFVLNRGIRYNDFRASGSSFNYLSGSKSKLPEGFLDFALSVRKTLGVPNVSLDIVFDGSDLHVVEFQALFFGTTTINLSADYYQFENNIWATPQNDHFVEYYYVHSVVKFLREMESSPLHKNSDQ